MLVANNKSKIHLHFQQQVMDCILAIDIGTTNCKAIVFDASGKMISSLKNTYETFSDASGKSEQKPDEVFNAVLFLLQKSLQQNKHIVAVCFSAAMHSLIAIDANGKALTNAMLWSDTRATKQALQLKETEMGTIIYSKTGTPVHPMSPLCKIIWLQETMPDVFQQPHKFISIKEFVFNQLFGTYIIDYSIASATGLFDIKEKVWCDEALAIAGITADALSTPVEVTHSQSDLLPKYKTLLQTEKPLQFIAGGNDGCLANLGSGVIEHRNAALTIGTSGAIRMTANNAITDQKQRTFTYLLTKDIYITGGAINNGGITLEWLSKLLMNDVTPAEPDELLQLAQTSAAGANHLLFLPYLLGERAPMWDATAKGVLFGLTQQHTKADIARATLEGICFALRDVLKAIEEVNGTITTIYASGGFTKSTFWLQTMSDILSKEILLNNSADASATGAAIIGLYALGYIKNLEESKKMFAVQQTFFPQASTQEIYGSLFSIFQSLYPKLKEEFTAISKL